MCCSPFYARRSIIDFIGNSRSLNWLSFESEFTRSDRRNLCCCHFSAFDYVAHYTWKSKSLVDCWWWLARAKRTGCAEESRPSRRKSRVRVVDSVERVYKRQHIDNCDHGLRDDGGGWKWAEKRRQQRRRENPSMVKYLFTFCRWI